MVITQSNIKGMFIMITTFNANWEDESVDYDALLNSAARSGTVSHTIPLLHPWDGRVSLVSNTKDTLTIIPGWKSGTVPPKLSSDTKDTLPSWGEWDCTPQIIIGYQKTLYHPGHGAVGPYPQILGYHGFIQDFSKRGGKPSDAPAPTPGNSA